MTTMVMSEELKNLILNGFPEDIRNPFSNGKLRFDNIKISNLNDHIGGVKVEFYWNGRATH